MSIDDDALEPVEQVEALKKYVHEEVRVKT